MACSSSLCLGASTAPPASCSSSSPFLSTGHVSSAPTVRYGLSSRSNPDIHYIKEAMCKASWLLLVQMYASGFLSRPFIFGFPAPKGKRNSGENVVMVDPLEAKRLAAKQMQEVRAREKLKRRRQAEAINGALAMIGLTAGLVLEGQTGKGILGQLAGYLEGLSSLFGQ
ncbi:hypothetical protein ACP70R_026671 [Stipagrostis hirtigluma subsp. patula]